MTRRPRESAVEIFGRHLDLTPLRGRHRGLVRCPFHQDRTPSLSVDLEAGMFHCFGCGASGGIAKFRELVGEQPTTANAETYSPSQRSTRTPLLEARTE